MNRVQMTPVAESELQRALDCGELMRLYQPVVSLATGAPAGRSSSSRRRGFPLDVVKLDPRFVRRLETEERLRAVVDGAHEAGVVVVVMAVEDEEMAAGVRRAGFDLAQGFHVAHPEGPSRVDELLDSL